MTVPKEPVYDVGLACVLVYRNYGSAFTNFALYNLLCDSDRSVLLINQPLSSEISPTEPENFATWSYPDVSRTAPSATKSDMTALCRRCKKILVGSDQLFNYEIYKRIDGFTKLDWADDTVEKVSYATSFGINEIMGDEAERSDFCRCIRRFRHLSVREESAVALVKENFNVSASCVLDPVFLCDTSHYTELIGNADRTPRGVFCYVLDPDVEKQRIAETVASALSQPIYALSDMWRDAASISALWSLPSATAVSNEAWLAALYSSSYVVTDSFHCLSFALLFNKPFVALYNDLRGCERQLSLLKKLGLEDRLILPHTGEADILHAALSPIDWHRINEIIEREKGCSLHWFYNNVLL